MNDLLKNYEHYREKYYRSNRDRKIINIGVLVTLPIFLIFSEEQFIHYIGIIGYGIFSVICGLTFLMIIIYNLPGVKAEYNDAKHQMEKIQRVERKRAFIMKGTPFQLKVWVYLKKIPRGSVKTYSQVAKGIGKPLAVRAVANAIGKNPYAPKIPCHRVIRSDGSLGGYSGKGGIKTKKLLLKREGITL
jgi:methylated-DNA-[protein]-cysteine S-methyltransferase